MIYADLKALHVTLDGFVISGETAAHAYAVVEDLKSAAIAQDAYHKALTSIAPLPDPTSDAFDYATKTPHVFAQAWVRSLRAIAGELTALAGDPVTSDAARAAARSFSQVFPGVASQAGPMRVMISGEKEVYYADGPGRYPVRIDDAAVRALEGVARTLIDALPKEKPFRATA